MSQYHTHTIIVPIYNAPKEVALCLASLEKSLDFDTVELILIDDASKAETKELISSFSSSHSQVKHICHEQNQGYLNTVNEGLRIATGDVITSLNSDTTIPQNFSQRILSCFNHKTNVGIASPILAKGIPFSVPLPKGLTPLDIDTMDAKIREQKPSYPTIVFPDGACFSISRACFEKVGFFDTCYENGYFEELDYSMRATNNGFDTVFIDNLYVYHRAHASFDKEKTKNLMKRNREIFMEKWGEEYTVLHKKNPKRLHKKGIYKHFYSTAYYYYSVCMLKLAKIIPSAKLRRKIRHKFQ